MTVRLATLLAVVFLAFAFVPRSHGALDGSADTVQSPDDVFFDGSAFLLVEAESAAELAGPEGGFLVVDKDNPIQTRTQDQNGNPVVKGGLDVLPSDTNALGGAALFDDQPSSFAPGTNTATWEVEFALPGTYYLYVHWSVYNGDTNTSYLNEDSFYVAPAFNKNSSTDWIGFEGFKYDPDTGEPGEPLIGDSVRDGYIDGFPTLTKVLSAGVEEPHNSTDEDFWDGQFHWSFLARANDMNADNGFISFDGQVIQYEVAEEDVGTTVTFEISTREAYGAIDALLFTTNNRLLHELSQEQVDAILNPTPGDLDFNQQVDFDDIGAFVLGLNDPILYESVFGLPPTVNGDIDGNGSFDFDDIAGFVSLLTGESGAAVVPEPSTWAMISVVGGGMFLRRRRRRSPRRSGG